MIADWPIPSPTAERDRLRGRLLKARELESVALLASGVAHDFNNILAGISGYAEALRLRLADGSLRDQAQRIFEAAKRGAYVVQGLLAFSAQRRMQSEPIELNRMLLDEREELRKSLGASIALRLELSASEQRIRGDAEGNKARGSFACLSATDTGIGMDDATQKRLFEPFFTKKEFGSSADIGLAAAYGIVRQRGGFIDVRSAPGEGAIFPASSRRKRRARGARAATCGRFTERGLPLKVRELCPLRICVLRSERLVHHLGVDSEPSHERHPERLEIAQLARADLVQLVDGHFVIEMDETVSIPCKDFQLGGFLPAHHRTVGEL